MSVAPPGLWRFGLARLPRTGVLGYCQSSLRDSTCLSRVPRPSTTCWATIGTSLRDYRHAEQIRNSCLAGTVRRIPIRRGCGKGFPPEWVRERILAPGVGWALPTFSVEPEADGRAAPVPYGGRVARIATHVLPDSCASDQNRDRQGAAAGLRRNRFLTGAALFTRARAASLSCGADGVRRQATRPIRSKPAQGLHAQGVFRYLSVGGRTRMPIRQEADRLAVPRRTTHGARRGHKVGPQRLEE